MNFPEIPKDKWLHAIGGLIIASAVTLVLPDQVLGTSDEIVALLVTMLIGAAKEYRDSLGFGNTEFADFFATVAGAIPILIFT